MKFLSEDIYFLEKVQMIGVFNDQLKGKKKSYGINSLNKNFSFVYFKW